MFGAVLDSGAVYLYPAEHYAAWRQELPDMALPWGMFGENFTTEGILEATMHIGDRLRIGTAGRDSLDTNTIQEEVT